MIFTYNEAISRFWDMCVCVLVFVIIKYIHKVIHMGIFMALCMDFLKIHTQMHTSLFAMIGFVSDSVFPEFSDL